MEVDTAKEPYVCDNMMNCSTDDTETRYINNEVGFYVILYNSIDQVLTKRFGWARGIPCIPPYSILIAYSHQIPPVLCRNRRG